MSVPLRKEIFVKNCEYSVDTEWATNILWSLLMGAIKISPSKKGEVTVVRWGQKKNPYKKEVL